MNHSCQSNDENARTSTPPTPPRLSMDILDTIDTTIDTEAAFLSLTSSLTIDSPAYSTLQHAHSHGHANNNTDHNNTNNNTNIKHSTSSIIYDQSRITDWRKVQTLATSQPHHASYKCDHGLTALHHACTRRCPIPSVFQALIQAYPHAIIEQDDGKGWTPLHHACRFKCPKEGIRLLLQSVPDYGRYAAKVRDKEKGRTALYYAIRYNAPEGVVELLLGCMDRMDILDCDRDGMSVLGLLWDKWVGSFEGRRIMAYYVKIFEQWKKLLEEAQARGDEELNLTAWNQILEQSKELREGLKGKLKDNWDKVNMILRGAFRFDLKAENSNGRKWRILHAIASIHCHSSLFLMASILHPEQARELDCNDLLGGDQPMQKGASQSQSQSQSQSASAPNKFTAMHFAAKSPTCGSESKVVLQQLLLFYPESANLKNPGDHSLPLHYLCENESKQHWVHDGIRTIYDAYPAAATEQDVDGRTPLHRAATLHESGAFFSPPAPPPSFVSSPARLTSSSRAYSSASGDSTNVTASSRTSNSNAISSAEDPVGSIIQNILSNHPEVAAMPDVSGKLLLHSIAECAENWDPNVQAVYDAFPAALSRRELVTRGLPLHLVASNLDAKPRLLQKIVEYHPRAASLVDGEGRLPLHLACEAGKGWFGGLEDVYNAYTNAVHVAEEKGRRWMPLHFVVASPYSSAETIERILGLGPDVAHVADSLGCTPFHIAVESGRDWEEGGLRSLFQANPEAIDVPDGDGKIPLVTALLNLCSDHGVSSDHDFHSSSHLPTQPLDEQAEGRLDDGRDTGVSECDVLETTHLAQVNVVFHLLRSAPHVLAPIG